MSDVDIWNEHFNDITAALLNDDVGSILNRMETNEITEVGVSKGKPGTTDQRANNCLVYFQRKVRTGSNVNYTSSTSFL
jgi:hypothetical protein